MNREILNRVKEIYNSRVSTICLFFNYLAARFPSLLSSHRIRGAMAMAPLAALVRRTQANWGQARIALHLGERLSDMTS